MKKKSISIKVNIGYKVSILSKPLHGILDEENSNMHVPLLERGPTIALSLRSKYLRTGRAPKDLKISLSR